MKAGHPIKCDIAGKHWNSQSATYDDDDDDDEASSSFLMCFFLLALSLPSLSVHLILFSLQYLHCQSI